MKIALSLLLSFLMVVFSVSPAIAQSGIGGSSGGSSSKMPEKWITVNAMAAGEVGEEVKQIRLKYRPPSADMPEQCLVAKGDAEYIPCSKFYGAKQTLKNLDVLFEKNDKSNAIPPGQKVDPNDIFKELEAP
jgi:hypothetical protein